MPMSLPVLSAVALMLLPLNPAAEHNRLQWIFGKGFGVEADGRKQLGGDWKGGDCRSGFVLRSLEMTSQEVTIDWSTVGTVSVEPEDVFVTLAGPFPAGKTQIKSLRFRTRDPMTARAAAEAMTRLRNACTPQR